MGAQEDAQPASLLGGHAQGRRRHWPGWWQHWHGRGQGQPRGPRTLVERGCRVGRGATTGGGRRPRPRAARTGLWGLALLTVACETERRASDDAVDVAAEFYVGRHLSPLLRWRGLRRCDGASWARWGTTRSLWTQSAHDGSISPLRCSLGWETFERRFTNRPD